MKLTEDMKTVLTEELAYIATADNEGNPNVGPKRTLRILNDHQLIYCENTGGQHYANIQANGKISVTVIQRTKNHGYRFNGVAKAYTDEEHMNLAKEHAGVAPKKACVIIDIKKMFTMDSGPLAGKVVEE